MRKNIIALILALPLLFVFVVFSAANTASLDVPIKATGIQIFGKPEQNVLRVDLADYKNDFEIDPEVQPEKADKSFRYEYRTTDGSEPDEDVAGGKIVEVDEDGKILAHRAGSVRVVAISKDGNFEDSFTVIVGSSKPYDFSFSLYDSADREEDLLAAAESGEGYTAQVATGRYFYSTKLLPNGFLSPEIRKSAGSFLETDAGSKSLIVPFSGTTEFDVVISDGLLPGEEGYYVGGELVKHVVLETPKADSFTVNGSTENPSLIFDRNDDAITFYVEADEEPAVRVLGGEGSPRIPEVRRVHGDNGYEVTITYEEPSARPDTQSISVDVGGESKTFDLNFSEFQINVSSDTPIIEGVSSVLLNSQVDFYAAPQDPSMSSRGVSYEWEIWDCVYSDGSGYGEEADIHLDDKSKGEGGNICTIMPAKLYDFDLVVIASRNGEEIDSKTISVHVCNYVTDIDIASPVKGRGGACAQTPFTVAGWKYENGTKAENDFVLSVTATSVDRPIEGVGDLDFDVSDPTIAAVNTESGVPVLEINRRSSTEGALTITASWSANEAFGEAVAARITLYVAKSAVEVTTSAQLYENTEAGNAVVLGASIMLGADDEGKALPVAQRAEMLAARKIRSTYNTEFYTNSRNHNVSVAELGEPEIYYAIEFKNDVYGNGYRLNAEYFTNAKDGDAPRFFKGPLFFVRYASMASVAAQDNIAYLVRTDGVTLHDVELLGCNDEALVDETTGMNNLSLLNNVGTVLEINADADILNCRIRNGRNVVRAYGGNRSASKYFIERLSESSEAVSDEDRINVRIEGCILVNGREFLLKLGANKALRAAVGNALSAEPALKDRNGRDYDHMSGSLYLDPYFDSMYVMTDVVLKDSVLETSGLFCVGVEANFSGGLLNGTSAYSNLREIFETWAGTGGTSFASVLHLKGDVKMCDWKQLSLIDSSTLIQSSPEALGEYADLLSLNIGGMLNAIRTLKLDEFGDVIEDVTAEGGDTQYVHGGIAFYGGGRNYSQLDISELNDALKEGLNEYTVGLKDFEGTEMDSYAFLAEAAGNQPFRFYLYGAGSPNSRTKQEQDLKDDLRYKEIKPVSPF